MWALECLKVKLPRYRHTVAPTHFQKQVGRGTWLRFPALVWIPLDFVVYIFLSFNSTLPVDYYIRQICVLKIGPGVDLNCI